MHRLNEEVALSNLDSLVQILDGVVILHPHSDLVDDDARIHTVVDEKDGGSGNLDPVRKGVTRALHARKRGQQRRMGVDQPSAKCRKELWTYQLHVAGHHYQGRLELRHEVSQLPVPFGSISTPNQRMHERGDVRSLRPLKARDLVPVRPNSNNLGAEVGSGGRIDQRLQQCS